MSRARDAGKARRHTGKKSRRATGDEHGIIARFWEIVTIIPKISSAELEGRVEKFIMSATAGQLLAMQKALFDEATPYLTEDPRVRKVMDTLSGKKIGLAIVGEYGATVTLDSLRFTADLGICEDIPVISIASRRDYADGLLKIQDPMKLILSRKLKVSHKLMLVRWGLPHIDLLRDKGLFDKFLAYQPEVERVIDENLCKMGY